MALLCLLVGESVAREWLDGSFSLREGGQFHQFLWTDHCRVHLALRPDKRFVAAFPAQNSGIAVWLGPGSQLSGLKEARAIEVPGGTGLTVRLHCGSGQLKLDTVLLGSIRSIRDVQSAGPSWDEREIRAREAYSHTHKAPANWAQNRIRTGRGYVSWARQAIDGGWFRLDLRFPPAVKVGQQGGHYWLRHRGPFDLELRLQVPYLSAPGYAPAELFSPAARGLFAGKAPEQVEPRLRHALRGLLFLAPQDKFMAGSWRFLTYFGRDTLLSLMMLDPVIEPVAYRRGLESVLERLAADGQVAHEEDLGEWSCLERIKAGKVASSRPGFDYKMVDDDFMLAPALATLGRRDPAQMRELIRWHWPEIRRNLSFVLRQARPFAAVSGPEAFRHLIGLRSGQVVGDWRDSREGLGWGRYPSSVNLDLVEAALRAVPEIRAALPADLRDSLPPEWEQIEPLITAWQKARDLFRVHLTESEVRGALSRYLSRAELSEAQREFLKSRPVAPGGPTVARFVHGQSVPQLADGLDFMALSLGVRGQKVAVMNTDFAFGLFLGRPPRAELEADLKLLELNFPVGLMTDVGPVVANPVYSSQEVHWRQLGFAAYHGSVVWSWQSAMLQLGLYRQLQTCDADLRPRIRACLERLQASEVAAGDLAGSELWAVAPGRDRWKAVAWVSRHADESNPVQLWSCVYPALVLVRSDQSP